jgi:hypothetical protein
VEYMIIHRDSLAFQQPVVSEHIQAMYERAFGQGVVIHSVRELGGGQFNNSYLLDLAEHAPMVLCVAPAAVWAVLGHERFLMRRELAMQPFLAPIANVAHQMSVQVMLYDGNGQVTSENTYLLQGDEWMMQGDIIKFPAWLNVIGFHAGYKLTRLEGRFDDIALENTARHTAIALNGGEDTFFQTTYMHKQWFALFVDAAYGNAVFQAPGSFDVFATQDALIARPTG